MPQIEKILIRIPQWLGDAVVSTIFVREVKSKYPDSAVSVLGPPAFKAIFSLMAEVDSYLSLPHPYSNQTWSVGASLRKESFTRLFTLPRSARAAIEALASRIPARIGFKGTLRALAFSETAPYYEDNLYPDRYMRLLGDVPSNLDRKPFFPSSGKTVLELTEALSSRSGDLKPPFLGIAPFSIAPARTWQTEKFLDVANRFIEKEKGAVIFIGSSSEKEKLLELQKGVRGPSAVNGGDLSFPDVGALFEGLQGFIGNDSGLMHVASAFGVPSVIVFGASDSTWALPQAEKMEGIQDKQLFCSPCLKNHCVRTGEGHLECLKNISSQAAFETLIRLLHG